MKVTTRKNRSIRWLLLPIFGVALLCLWGAAVGIANTHAARATSTMKQSVPTPTPVLQATRIVNQTTSTVKQSVPTPTPAKQVVNLTTSTVKQSDAAPTPVLQSIRMINQLAGWATANTTTILHTVNGGYNWTNVTPQYSVAKPQSFVTTFRDAQHGWIAYEPQIGDDTFTILHTADGGTSWQRSAVSTVSGSGIAALTFNTVKDGWILVGDNGGPGAGSESFSLFSTTDGGWNWTSLPDVHTSDQITGLSFSDAKNGYLTYGGPYSKPTMSVTHNGGYSWQTVSLPVAKVDTDLVTTPPVFFGATGYLPVGSTGPAAGFDIYTSHDCGKTWSASGSQVTTGEFNTRLAGVGDLYIVNPNHFYVTNVQGQTLVSTDQGASWHTVAGTVGLDVTSLSFINSQQGWAAGNGLLHTNDGGNTWQKINYTVQ